MKRTLIQLEEDMYNEIRRRAFQEKKSISGLIRGILGKQITLPNRSRHLSIKDFKFVAAGRSKQGTLRPVSERHDEALVEAFRK